MSALREALIETLLVPRRCRMCRRPTRGASSLCGDEACRRAADRIRHRAARQRRKQSVPSDQGGD